MPQPVLINIKKDKGLKFRQMLKDFSLDELLFAPIDVAKFKHDASFVNYYGDVVLPPFSFPNTREGVKLYLSKLAEAKEKTKAKKIILGLESTGHYHENLQIALENRGLEVILINPFEVWQERDCRSRKTDELDLGTIANVLIHNKGSVTKLKRDLQYQLTRATRTRRKFVQQQATAKVIIRGLVDRIFPGLQDKNHPVFSDFWGKASFLLLERYPAPQNIISLGEKRLARFFIKNNTKLGLATAERIVSLAKNALTRDYQELEIDLLVLSKYLRLFKELDNSIRELEQQITKLFIQTPGVYLLSIPSVSLIYAAEYIAEIGDPCQYQHYRQIINLAGAASRTYESGEFAAEGLPISKHGNKFLRTTINQLGNGLKCKGKKGCPYFAAFAQRLLDRGKHPRSVNFAVGAKFVRVSLPMLKQEAFFRPLTVRACLNLDEKKFMIACYRTIIRKLSNFSSDNLITEGNYLSKIKKNIESKYHVNLN